jgi:hypothetical protein
LLGFVNLIKQLTKPNRPPVVQVDSRLPGVNIQLFDESQ